MRFAGQRAVKIAAVCMSVFMMGVGVSLLRLTHFGTDPCSAMNYGISYLSGIPFGTCQLLYNAAALLFVTVFDGSYIGAGTFANMFLVGYTADLFSIVWAKSGIPALPSLSMRLLLLAAGLAVFVLFAAVYANSGQGLAPYDALADLLARGVGKLLHRRADFKAVRIFYDGAHMLVGFLLGGEAGFVTLAMALFLGPAIQGVGRLKKYFRGDGPASAFRARCGKLSHRL